MLDAEPTLCRAIILSDMVVKEEGTGKLTLVGCFQHYNAPGFPFKTPPLFVTISVTNLSEKVHEMAIVVRIENAKDGHVLASASLQVAFNKEPVLNDVFDIPFPFPGFQIPSAGVYKIVILADNEVIGDRVFSARSITASTKEKEA